MRAVRPCTAILLAALSLSWLAAPALDCDSNGVDDALQIQGAAYLDCNGNGLLDLCENLSVDRGSISLSAGGVQELSIHINPGFASSLYWTLGTTAGTSPGTQVDFLNIPLNDDGKGGYMQYTIGNPNSQYLQFSRNFISQGGRGLVYFTVPAGTEPALAGVVIHHAVVVFAPPSYDLAGVTNYVSCELVP